MTEPTGFSTIRYEALGAVAHLTLDRPERANALNGAMLDEIGRASTQPRGMPRSGP